MADVDAPVNPEAKHVLPPGSRYAGQEVDVSSRRSISIQHDAGDDLTLTADAAHCCVDFFYHEGRYWRAKIPLDGVSEIFGQVFNFSKVKTSKAKSGREIVTDQHGIPRHTIPILNHLQCRFSFRVDQPVELYPQESPDQSTPAHRVDAIVYSLEAVGPSGVTFSIRDGMAGNLISAHRVMSLQEMVFERIVVENQYVTESPPLPLNDREKRALLVKSLLRSHRAGMGQRYYLYRVCGTNNCTSNPFQILDEVVDYRWLPRIGSMLYRLPLSPRLYLRVRGMDSDPQVRKLVRHEFEDFINDKQTRQRKRQRVKQQTAIRRAARAAAAGDS